MVRLLLLLAVVVAGCGDAGTPPAPLVGGVPDTTQAAGPTPLAVESLSPDESTAPDESADVSPAESTAPAAKPLAVKVAKRTRTVNPGDTASITITTKKGAKCSIDVEYESGRSTAKGLGAKKADAKGQVKWSWLVGINANPQVVGISIGCALGGRSGQVSSSITVK